MKAELKPLLGFIQGIGHRWGPGIFTKPGLADRDERLAKLHQACLELEQLGLIYRHFDSGKIIAWMPVEEVD